jgi:transcriptional regulator with XRE-family HTH domain
MSLGQYLRELRDKRDISLREFAKKLDCSAAFVSDVELGRRYPSEKVLKDMARVLGVSIDELKERDARPPVEEMKRRAADDPRLTLAFRTLVDLPPEQLLKIAARERQAKKPK